MLPKNSNTQVHSEALFVISYSLHLHFIYTYWSLWQWIWERSVRRWHGHRHRHGHWHCSIMSTNRCCEPATSSSRTTFLHIICKSNVNEIGFYPRRSFCLRKRGKLVLLTHHPRFPRKQTVRGTDWQSLLHSALETNTWRESKARVWQMDSDVRGQHWTAKQSQERTLPIPQGTLELDWTYKDVPKQKKGTRSFKLN